MCHRLTMAAAAPNHDVNEEQLRKARRIQELFRSRFAQDEVLRLLEHCNWDVNEAVNFALSEEPEVVRQVCGSGEDWIAVRNDRVTRDLAMRNRIPFQVRQFGCQPCDNMWWRRVPTRKMVSRCKRCRRRYEAVPKEHEWGWAKFTCQSCGHEFHGFGQMNKTLSPCYNCGTLTPPEEVLPPYRRGPSRGAHHHSCAAPNCFNRTVGAGVPGQTMCVHPRSLRRRVVTPSLPHNSTGSTISTVLTQDDIQSFAVFDPIEPDISEDDSSENGDNPGN